VVGGASDLVEAAGGHAGATLGADVRRREAVALRVHLLTRAEGAHLHREATRIIRVRTQETRYLVIHPFRFIQKSGVILYITCYDLHQLQSADVLTDSDQTGER